MDNLAQYLAKDRNGGLLRLNTSQSFCLYSQPLKDTMYIEILSAEIDDAANKLVSMIEYIGRTRGCKYILASKFHTSETEVYSKLGFEPYKIDLLYTYYRKGIN